MENIENDSSLKKSVRWAMKYEGAENELPMRSDDSMFRSARRASSKA